MLPPYGAGRDGSVTAPHLAWTPYLPVCTEMPRSFLRFTADAQFAPLLLAMRCSFNVLTAQSLCLPKQDFNQLNNAAGWW